MVDVAEGRRGIVEALGARFAAPDAAPGDADVVFHTSAHAAGLATAIQCAGPEASIIEMSWYGEKEVPVALGGPFHSRRLKLISSQVGQVAPSRRSRWTYRRRMEAALKLLADQSALDALVADEIAFTDTPKRLPELLTDDAVGLAPVISYRPT